MSDLFSKVGIDLGVVVLLLIVLIIVMMIMTVSMSLRLSRLNQKYRSFMKGKDAQIFSIAGFAVGAVGVTVTFGLGGVVFAVPAFFTVFFFLEVFGWLTSSVIPQRSSRVGCTPAEYCGRGSISGFSAAGCGFSVGVSTVCAEDTVSNFMAGRSTLF